MPWLFLLVYSFVAFGVFCLLFSARLLGLAWLFFFCSSERASATNNRGEQLRQGANINKSLLSLANCINALAGNRRRRGGKVGQACRVGSCLPSAIDQRLTWASVPTACHVVASASIGGFGVCHCCSNNYIDITPLPFEHFLLFYTK